MKIIIEIKGGTYKGQKYRLYKAKRLRILNAIDYCLGSLQGSETLDIHRRVLKG